MTARNQPPLVKRLAPLGIAAVALCLFFAFELQHYFTLDALRDNQAALRNWVNEAPFLALSIFILAYAAAVAISFPGASILTIFGGFLFGLWPGIPAVVLAATMGATLIYIASKTALSDFLSARAGGFIKRMEQGFHEDELNYMLLLRLVPIFPFWAINIAAGVLGVSLRNFVVGTFFGIIPGSFVYASIGNAAGAAFDVGEDVSLSGILLKPETLLPIIGLSALALLPVIIKKFNKQAAKIEDVQ